LFSIKPGNRQTHADAVTVGSREGTLKARHGGVFFSENG